ncbi:hypothetical protein [Lysinibacillus xylanilyticus]|uniref:hypothetical protein n=1 Tax=Lysinibacillus xylanilyticus TaxID=582475 RepID=UPI003CFCB3E7
MRQQQCFNCAKAKRQQQCFNCAKAKRQQQCFNCAKAKRQQQCLTVRKRSDSNKAPNRNATPRYGYEPIFKKILKIPMKLN